MRSSKESLVCPYNKNHVMPSNRLEWHLIECKDKINQSSGFAICPYNALHHVPTQLLEAHIQTCKNKIQEREDVFKQMQATINSNPSHYKGKAQSDLPPGFAPVATKAKKKKKNSKNSTNNTNKKESAEDPNDVYLPTNKWLEPDSEMIGCIEGIQFGLPPGFEEFTHENKDSESDSKAKELQPSPINSKTKNQQDPLDSSIPTPDTKVSDPKPLPQKSEPILPTSKSQSPIKPHTPKDEDEWVTVKSKPKKKPSKKSDSNSSLPISQSDFNTLAEFQVSASITKNKKTLKKKLKEIQLLEEAYKRGEKLDPQQMMKLQSKEKIERELESL
ncbi:unnamed protein product [Blepharisma stoltei]|uniref:CHHC U11-48K-type domain-containing protein n=1 Tax=Blepharisma stoltei TaxID=1481888 RepID=A0AAU9IDI3_9CILI|nr:unnamed protein product [Blepharisma stoltei]